MLQQVACCLVEVYRILERPKEHTLKLKSEQAPPAALEIPFVHTPITTYDIPLATHYTSNMV